MGMDDTINLAKNKSYYDKLNMTLVPN